MASVSVAPTLPLNDFEALIAFYQAHNYVPLANLLTEAQVAAMNEAIDRDRKSHPFMWHCVTTPDYNCNLLLTEPVFEESIRQPLVLELVERLLGGPSCFEELAVRHTEPKNDTTPTEWHRDRGYWMEHPLRLDYPQIIYYLTDVDETTHCFTISPEPADQGPLETQEQVERGGTVYFHGKAGGGILFNCAALHGATHRQSTRHRRIIQVYYGHPHRPPLSEVSIIPPRLWRDHPDPEIRRFYGKLNHYTRVIHEALGVAIEQP